MEHISAGLRKLLFPGGRPVLLLVVLGAAALCLAFATRLGETPFAYIAYALSAYALTVSAVWFVTKAVPGLKRFLHGFALAHRYLTDNYFKVWASMLLSFFINLGFGIFRLACAVWYVSFWDGALAVYNVLLCAVRFYLLRRIPAGAGARDRNRELRQYRVTGIFLIALNAALGWIAVQIVQHGHSCHYAGTLIYAAALHAFYSLTLAAANAVKYRKFNSPVLSAAKMVNLTTALVSIFTLETAMLASFGGEYPHQKLMTASTAGGVWGIVFCMAVYMVIRSGRQRNRETAQ